MDKSTVVVVVVSDAEPPMCWLCGMVKSPDECVGPDCSFCIKVQADMDAAYEAERKASWYDVGNGTMLQCEVFSVSEQLANDPIRSGCDGEIVAAARRRDIKRGCPHCQELVMENASEPEVAKALLRG